MTNEELMQLIYKTAMLARRQSVKGRPLGERPPERGDRGGHRPDEPGRGPRHIKERPPFRGVPLRSPMPYQGQEPGQATVHRERERVLTLLHESEGISQRKLALILDIRPQSLSELLGKLEKDGLITRQKNEEDKREILVYLTDAGRERAAAFEAMLSEARNSFLAPLSPEERETLGALLEKLVYAGESVEEI